MAVISKKIALRQQKTSVLHNSSHHLLNVLLQNANKLGLPAKQKKKTKNVSSQICFALL
jgi:hypothetical protein